MSPLLLNLLLALTGVGCFTLYRAVWGDGREFGERLFSGPVIAEKGGASERLSALVRRAGRRRSETRGSGASERKFHSTLTYTGFRSIEAVAIFQLVRAALMIGLAALGFASGAAAGKSSLGGAAVGSLIGYALPSLVIHRLARSRQLRVITELPDVLALLVVSLEAGIGFSEVINWLGAKPSAKGGCWVRNRPRLQPK